MFSDFPGYLIGILSILIGLALIFAKKSGRFFKSLLISIIGGLGSLCAVGVVGQFITLSIGVNLLTVVVAATLSVPGVIMLLLTGIILT